MGVRAPRQGAEQAGYGEERANQHSPDLEKSNDGSGAML